ncbi:MAG: MFS transporter [Terracidiphilus sp.]|nr:MFS transporter [Terracidiphilus sp.]
MKQRHQVLGLLGALSVLTFLDRMAIAVAGPRIQLDLHIEPHYWGWILSAYVFANGVFEIPFGALGDKIGQRKVLPRIVAWWSSFNLLTSWCQSFWQLCAARFFFGLGAAGAYPNCAGAIARWFPKGERASAQGVVWAASRLGGALAPLLIIPFIQFFGWRPVFAALGVVGFVWAAAFRLWYRDRPEEMPGADPAEVAEIGVGEPAHGHGKIPWREMARCRSLWLIVAAYGCYACGSWFYFSWFPTWLVHSAGLSMNGVALAALPFLVGLMANLAGGWLGDWLTVRWGALRALRTIPTVCLVLTAVVLASMAVFHGKVTVVALSCLGFGLMDLMLPSAWALCVAIGGRFSGTATATMNTAGQVGGLLCTVTFGYIVHATGSYNLPLWFIAGMVLVSAGIFSLIDAGRGLGETGG